MSLVDLHARLSRVYDSIRSFDVPSPQLPVIDTSPLHEIDRKQPLPGLRFLRDEVKRDCEVLDNFLREDANDSSAFSTNAPYLIAVWDELVRAHQPLAVYRMFSLADRQDEARKKTSQGPKAQTRAVKVDVVAENGSSWVRVNTIKNARLMVEFREIDSYLTSDEDEHEPTSRTAQTELDNSVLRMGRDLLAAAKANPTPFSPVLPHSDASNPNPAGTLPRVTIRLTRLDPLAHDASDTRIHETVQRLRDMGIDVQLGERPYLHSAIVQQIPTTRKLLEPTTNVNLDLSVLIALISDISHSPLPRMEEEAYTRFVPPQSYLDWKKDRVKSLRQNQTAGPSRYHVEDEDTWENSEQHSRALAAQTIQEMKKGILEDIYDRLSAVVGYSSQAPSKVTFWVTREARHRCLQIVSKIGGETERQRANALLGLTRAPPVSAPMRADQDGLGRSSGTSEVFEVQGNASADTYWEHSRFPAGFLPLAPVQIYPSILPAKECEDMESRTSFFDALTLTCTRILSHEAVPLSSVLLPVDQSSTSEDMFEEIPSVMQTSIPKLTVHTVGSMLAGASRGHTTLTTNRSSVKAILKEMRKVCGREVGCEPGMGDVEKAALWTLDPRSLSEGMRSE